MQKDYDRVAGGRAEPVVQFREPDKREPRQAEATGEVGSLTQET